MDFLSAVAMVTKRREYFLGQSKKLANKYRSLGNLEKAMAEESKHLVRALRDQQVKFDEYERTLTDKAIVASLAAVYLGSEGNRADENMSEAFSSIVGKTLPYLLNFTKQTEFLLNDGTLAYKDDFEEFDEYPEEELEEWEQEIRDSDIPLGVAAASIPFAVSGSTVGKTWSGVLSRVVRYLVTPLYHYFNLGVFLVKRTLGFKEMRRVPRNDSRMCEDCERYGQIGWAPIGSLPLPGQECRCYDRCRCKIEYR